MRIAILGADGRMGRSLVRAVVAAGPESTLTAATERAGSPALGQDAGVVATGQALGVPITEGVPAHSVGTALTVQTSLGFLLTMISIQLVPPVQHLVGWRWAFAMLALGPAFGILAIRALTRASAQDLS